MVLSKMAKECEECSFKYICNKKKMVAYAVLNSTSNVAQDSQPIGIAYTPVTIKTGDSGEVQTSLEDLKKQMLRDFYKKIGVGGI